MPLKLRGRAVASVSKMPGLPKMSGYPHVQATEPEILLTMNQMKDLLEESFARHKLEGAKYEERIQDLPKSTFNIPKSRLFIKLISNSTRHERNILKNNLLNYVKDDTFAFDSVSFTEDLNESMKLLDIINYVISFICFSLGLF